MKKSKESKRKGKKRKDKRRNEKRREEKMRHGNVNQVYISTKRGKVKKLIEKQQDCVILKKEKKKTD